MKKKILIMASIIGGILLTGCDSSDNQDILGGNSKYDTAILTLPDGTIVEGEVTSWRRFGQNQVQINMGGTWYMVGSENVALIGDEE